MNVTGTWRLLKAIAFDATGKPAGEPYGPVPMGRIVFTETGRMMAVVCDGRPRMPPGETREYASYCGNFRIEGVTLITTVDAAAKAERLGGEQVRQLRMDGEHLVLISPKAGGAKRELTWSREGPA